MATKYYNFKGKIKWTQNVHEPDEFNGQRFWKISVFDLDENSKAEFAQSGIRITPKTDGDGDTLYTFRRSCTKLIKGELIEFEPPAYIDSEGNDITVQVANGSEAIVNVAVYDAGAMGKGHRLQGIKVTNLIEYVPDTAEPVSRGVDKSIFE